MFSGENFSVTQIIQLMLAPGVMINACGLLLLGINNKYSMVVNRVRLLNEEKRRLTQRAADKHFSYEDNIRLESIAQQLKRLVFRVRLVRNCVLCYTSAIAFFVTTSFLIGVQYFLKEINLTGITVASFILGMTMVITGVIFAFFETKKGYDIVQFEVKADE